MEMTATRSQDFTAVKTKQHAAWSAGDYSVVGVTLQIVGENLCEALDLHGGQSVLDVAAGNGNCSLAAARRFCNVVSTDYVQDLLRRGRERADAEHLPMEFQLADAEALPFANNAFDVVMSSFGVMFAPDQASAAAELLRVCKPGGKIGELDPRQLHRSDVQNDRALCTASSGTEVPGIVGHARATDSVLRRCGNNPGDRTRFHHALSFTPPLD
jgi:ubiquinone/menaquinone biosynthesis C-methylase UbiE